jgi:hypothetical protein
MRLHLGYVLGLFAIALATIAGYVSVVGWGKLFAGEATVVMILMTILESAKIITTIYLHRYSKKLAPKRVGGFKNRVKQLFSVNSYLVLAVMLTMFLTSVGIYGFLTGAYQGTANKMELQNGEVSILEGKKLTFEDKISGNKDLIETKTVRINQLNTLRTQQEARIDGLLSKRQTGAANKVRTDIEKASIEIQNLNKEIDVLVKDNSILQDSVGAYKVKILEAGSNTDLAAEIGPLKYISTLTGRPMDSIINWIVLIIIFIFDPMAISLVLAANKVFDFNSKNDESDNTNDGNINDSPLLTPELNNNIKDGEVLGSIDSYIENATTEIIEPEPDDMVDTETEIGDDSPVDEEIIEEEETIVEEEIVKEEETIVEDLTPEAQLTHNKETIKNAIENFESEKKVKLPPVIPTGRVKREDIKEIKELGTRGFSVNVPEPVNNPVNNMPQEQKKFFFRRPR